MELLVLSTGCVAVLALVGLGGGLFEHAVIDRAWPDNPAIIQPRYGGVSRVWFWLPTHIALEVSLLATLALAWNEPTIRRWLLIALASHATMRIWSAFDHIPKALAFERQDPWAIDVGSARAWTWRSVGRLPLALTTGGAALMAFGMASRLDV